MTVQPAPMVDHRPRRRRSITDAPIPTKHPLSISTLPAIRAPGDKVTWSASVTPCDNVQPMLIWLWSPTRIRCVRTQPAAITTPSPSTTPDPRSRSGARASPTVLRSGGRSG